MTQRGKSGGGSGGSGGRRQQSVRVKTAHKRSLSSTLWLQRQLNDPYVTEAKRLGYRSRAAFKLLQLDEKFELLGPGKRIVDLGAAPGGWTQVAIARVGSDKGRGRVVGLDILPMEPIPGADLIQADFLAPEAPEQLRALLGGGADLVMSDMAAPTTGHAKTDHLRVIALAETALVFALEVLEPGGAFVAKVFQGGSEKDLLDPLKKHFAVVRHAKPAASRADSSEMYVVATGFRRVEDK